MFTIPAVWILHLPLNPFLSPCNPLSLYQMDSTAPEQNTDELLATSRDLSSKNNHISVKFNLLVQSDDITLVNVQ